LSLATLTFDFDRDIQTHPSEGPNVFTVNLAQIRSAIPEIFDAQTKNEKVAEGAKNRTLLACGQYVRNRR